MLATMHSIQHILQWLLQQEESNTSSSSSSSSSSNRRQQQQQQASLLDHALWLPSVKLLAECLLLVPTADMASSCLQLITLIMQPINAARRLPRETAQADIAAAAAAATSQEPLAAAETINEVMRTLTFRQLGPAVYHAVKHAADLKQRRQLLRLWANAAAALIQEAGEQKWRVICTWRVQAVCRASPLVMLSCQ
jgi:hypothetical protein